MGSGHSSTSPDRTKTVKTSNKTTQTQTLRYLHTHIQTDRAAMSLNLTDWNAFSVAKVVVKDPFAGVRRNDFFLCVQYGNNIVIRNYSRSTNLSLLDDKSIDATGNCHTNYKQGRGGRAEEETWRRRVDSGEVESSSSLQEGGRTVCVCVDRWGLVNKKHLKMRAVFWKFNKPLTFRCIGLLSFQYK